MSQSKKKYDIVVLTERQYVDPIKTDSNIENVLLEDKLVVEALRDQGFSVLKTNWDNEAIDWSDVDTLIFRTIWDYHVNIPKFMAWLKEVETTCRLINPAEIINWNIDKNYLKDLEASGIEIVPTVFVGKGETQSLQEIVDSKTWNNVVIKPAISAGARETYKILENEIYVHETIFKNLIAKEDMLVQPFIKSIEQKGELSFMVFGGKYSHTVLKKAKPGDFRVQDDFGGTVHEYIPTKEEIAFAERTVEACSIMPSYARVDAVWNDENQLCISELELIEPELWFRNKPESANELARYIKSNW
ncbi:MAG: glutathione synthase/RimK-type ligase-like ATP-grasp enzyme [Patiriisocius sp.]|jgi:glutathione synthase/RimK-type ligase-like ATP-grasp enzyme